ncbi:peptidylprolyl isomerase [Sulfurospirillum sp. T05]|uniref:Peptidylprolyl isomerase n=1 Tax=Sulfurospirillum tamanense TaxID=2813362 RepID=A0ABS2WRQ4_9BACT|nr:peptidylprolyl isomerase [Sulfurospirillum tamanensis]MBN2964349.1 peptidylprolyl isomerase [Sulfurospirillum tamanensis]
MITWMQRHRKYLVITIWVSVIAFVGAGFVGWGAYDFNADRSSAVAKVGERKISITEFQMAYNNYFSYYNTLFNGQLTQERAEQMGLDKIVLENLINEALMVNYAKDLGLIALDSDIKDALLKDENFHTNGAFDKDLYYRLLQNAGITAKTYEEGLKKQVLLEKLNPIIELQATEQEKELFGSALFMQDRLSVRVLQLDQDEIQTDEASLRAFWEPQKSLFLTPTSYTIDSIFVPASTETAAEEALSLFFEENKFNYRYEDGRLKDFIDALPEVRHDVALDMARKEALTTYLTFKKGEIEAEKTEVLYESDSFFEVELLKEAVAGEVLKPIATDEGYMIVKLVSINPPVPMDFEEAKPLIKDAYMSEKTQEVLTQKAKAQLDLFRGETIGFVTRDSVVDINGLNEEESSVFLSRVFDNNTRKGYVVLDDKAVLYEILEQKLLDQTKLEQYNKLIGEHVYQTKNSEVNQAFIEALKKRYTIDYFYKGN